MPKLFVYRIVTDGGIAPHISDSLLTLTLCKPGIRKAAQVGDYVLALVALQHTKLTGKGPDRYYKAAYLFAITEKVGMLEYDSWCRVHAPSKICDMSVNEDMSGNCQYNSTGAQRLGHHGPHNKNRDLSGKFSLISNHFAQWTSQHPHTLTDSEIDAIGLDRSQIQTATRNFFTIPLVSPEQTAALERLIAENKPTPAKSCRRGTCKKSQPRKKSQQTKKRGSRKAHTV
jgi:hypothetical protein